MSEDKLHKDAMRGRKAESLLKDELLAEAFDTLEKQYVKAWMDTRDAEATAREHYWRAAHILIDVMNHLRAVARDGRLAQAEIDRMGGVNRLS